MTTTKILPRAIEMEAFLLTEESRASNELWPEWMHVAWRLGREEDGSVSPLVIQTSPDTAAVMGSLVVRLDGVLTAVDYGDYLVRGHAGRIWQCSEKKYRTTYMELGTMEELDATCSHFADGAVETDLDGQVILYTGIILHDDGVFGDGPDNEEVESL